MKVWFTANQRADISKMITLFTEDKGKVKPTATHCFPVLGEIHGIELGLSADDIMINLIDVDRYRRDKDVSYRVYEIPDVVDPKVWIKRSLESYNQKIYPHLELVWFVWDWLKDKIEDHNKDHKNWIDYSAFCSELTLLTLRAAGFSGWFKGFDPNSITPTELEDLVKAIPGCKLIENADHIDVIYG